MTRGTKGRNTLRRLEGLTNLHNPFGIALRLTAGYPTHGLSELGTGAIKLGAHIGRETLAGREGRALEEAIARRSPLAQGLAPTTKHPLLGVGTPYGSVIQFPSRVMPLPQGVVPAAAEENEGQWRGGAVGYEDPEDEGNVGHAGLGNIKMRPQGGRVFAAEPSVDDYEERLLGALPAYRGLAPLLSRSFGRMLEGPREALGASEELRQGGDYNPRPALRAAMRALRLRQWGGAIN